MRLCLHHYWRSSSSWRVRWAFALKKIEVQWNPVDLLEGEQLRAEHLRRNPFGKVPVLEFLDSSPDGAFRFLADSMAIIEWAEETVPHPSLFPEDPLKRAKVRELANIIVSGIQPLQNLKVIRFHSKSEKGRKKWSAHWIREGLRAYETQVKKTAGNYSFGDTITLADLCLIPQCYNALRFDVSLEEFPVLLKIHTAALKTEECQASAPDRFQPPVD